MSGKFDLRQFDITFGDACFSFVTPYVRVQRDESEVSPPVYHCHLQYEAHCLLSGSGRIRLMKKGEVRMSEGEILILPPKEMHIGREPDTPDTVCYGFGFSLTKTGGNSGIYSCLEKRLRELTEPLCPIPMSPALREILFQLKELSDSPGIRCYCLKKTMFTQMLFALFDLPCLSAAWATDAVSSERRVRNPLQTAVLLEFLVNIRQMKLADIAAELGYSERQMSRIIKETYGCSFRALREKTGKHAPKGKTE